MLSYALISSSKVSRVRAGIACAVAAASLAGSSWPSGRGLCGRGGLASVVRSSCSRLFTVDRDGSASFRGRRSGTLRARKLRVVHTTTWHIHRVGALLADTNVLLALTFDHSLSGHAVFLASL